MPVQGAIFEGKTKEEAVNKGLRELGIDRSDVYIEVVEEGSGGFLGFGSRPYRIRLIPRVRRTERGPASGRGRNNGRRVESARAGLPPRDRRGERREEGRGERRREGRPAGRGPAPAPAGVERGERLPHERTRDREPGEAAPERGDAGERRRRRRGGRGRGGEPPREGQAPRGAPRRADEEPMAAGARGPRPAPRFEEAVSRRAARAEVVERPERAARAEIVEQPERAARAEIVEQPERGAGATPPAAGPPDAALAERARQCAADLFRHMGFDANVRADAAADEVNVVAEVAEDEDLVIGHKGEVRQALQQLLTRMLNKGEATRYHLHLEINDFWRRRESELSDTARRLADEAVATGSEMVTEYLNAQERRVVHVTLREDRRVKTYAIGEGLIKKVAIAPADYPEGPKPE